MDFEFVGRPYCVRRGRDDESSEHDRLSADDLKAIMQQRGAFL